MRFRFEPFTVDTHTRQLTREGAEVHLSPKAFDLLSILLERRPAVVRKTELREGLWPGVHVGDASLTNLIAEIRAALERSSAPAVIRTAHGVGYAFSGDVIEADTDGAVGSSEPARFWVVWNDRAIALVSGENVIGRDAACAVWIDGDGVSRRHARIRVANGDAEPAVTIEDLKSTNGTYLRGRRVTGVEQLGSGDRIRVGDATLVFRTRKDAETPTKRVRSPKS